MKKIAAFCLLVLPFGCSDARQTPPRAAPPVDSSPVTTAPASSARDTTANCAAAPDAMDRSICPGTRVGAVTAQSTIADLTRIYGAGAVRQDSVHLGEGEYESGLIVKVSSTDSLIITLVDDTLIGDVEIRSEGWRTAEGLRVGSPLSELERVYGKIRVYGFGFDGAGAVELPQSAGNVFFRVFPTVGGEEQPAAWSKVDADHPYPADDPSMRALKPAIAQIRVTFREPWD